MDNDEARVESLLKRSVAEVIVEEELKKRLLAGEKLRLKEGFDPSFTDIHLGHMVGLRKLRQFQEMGHQVVLIVGDWTAQIGDPSGQSVTRPMLSAEQVKQNAQTYMEQFFKVVDKQKTEVRWQSEWFGNFSLADVIRLTSKFTLAQMLAREDFNQRYQANQPISITEFLYPLLQAYDSVAIQSDVEFGGTDQKFNLLVGRELQSMVGQRPQNILMTPLLVGTDGVKKMSKSLGNYIGVADPPEEMFGKIMSIPDDLLYSYYELLTDISDEALLNIGISLNNETVNPMEMKKQLGLIIVENLYDRTSAEQAEEHFRRTIQQKELPDDISEYPVNPTNACLKDYIFEAGLCKSRGEAKRLITQGAVQIDGRVIDDSNYTLSSGNIIKVGKRRYVKCI
ncbi:MAG: tyrosine--tRNA ligase [Dehalococcoidales bacterium]|jgi:tyrosyl-tRNA synthetase|nr:tyrosine--tRNA ligase [Dehalococcoidales bacterium]MDD3264810.1 tyrosine--tRNA ligase [Dehalococcoidales bacterium]MDD4322396.1 tyrosine--tRNA ligase [Dehalococcoidales bacterium]MDD4794560.1 tyrosine--tRNA ligase [Dehalococcoidales bacterium]MDD5121884.1 tyrosine--tRNA ligase [Dehalococcoidales bacterium]